MRRLVAGLLCLMLMLSVSVTGWAASSASSGTLSATVAENGSCQVALELQLHLESADKDLTFPLPRGARNVTLNGSSARTRRSGDYILVDLGRLVGSATGDFSVRLQYSLPNVVDYNEIGQLELTLPMLSGFAYPVEQMQFSVILPGNVEGKTAFSSGYFQQTIESDITYTAVGNQISGSVLASLKDRETLTMTLGVSEGMFPQDPTRQWSVGVVEILMIALAVLALLYWLIFLRCAPFRRIRSTLPPQGLTAGQLSSALTGQGADLTMMVLSWAQLGYILIHLEDSGRVTLHKRMDMGNERSGYEVRIFNQLFGKRKQVDGTGYHYANLCRKVAAKAGDIRDLYQRRNGNPRVFRGLCALIGLFGGVSLGVAIAGDAVLGVLLIVILGLLGGISAWFMQDWVRGLHLNNKLALYIGLGLCGLWFLIGLAADRTGVALAMSAAQLLAGLMLAYGGRRTPLGRQTAAQILGLRRYLQRISPEEVKRVSRYDPDFYFNMAPYAAALGVNRSFARRFGRKRLAGCHYLTTGMDGHMTALEWSEVMDRAVTALDARQKRLPIERLMGR